MPVQALEPEPLVGEVQGDVPAAEASSAAAEPTRQEEAGDAPSSDAPSREHLDEATAAEVQNEAQTDPLQADGLQVAHERARAASEAPSEVPSDIPDMDDVPPADEHQAAKEEPKKVTEEHKPEDVSQDVPGVPAVKLDAWTEGASSQENLIKGGAEEQESGEPMMKAEEPQGPVGDAAGSAELAAVTSSSTVDKPAEASTSNPASATRSSYDWGSRDDAEGVLPVPPKPVSPPATPSTPGTEGEQPKKKVPMYVYI